MGRADAARRGDTCPEPQVRGTAPYPLSALSARAAAGDFGGEGFDFLRKAGEQSSPAFLRTFLSRRERAQTE